MCTVLLLLRPDHPWPLLVGANRDERFGRRFDAPSRHWPEAPGVTAGRDCGAGGSWFGVNDDGVVATIVNSIDRLGPAPGKATRGRLVLDALLERSARSAADRVQAHAAARYRGFTLIVADRRSAFALIGDERTIGMHPLAPGYHLIAPDGVDNPGSPRYQTHFPTLHAAPPPDPAANDWSSWTRILRHTDDDPRRAMTVAVAEREFGTVCSQLLALPAANAGPVFLFANGPPTLAPYEPVAT